MRGESGYGSQAGESSWKIQLSEFGVPTAHRYRRGRKQRWRPRIGHYTFPFFSEDGKVFLHLHKGLASTGKTLIYALEGHEKTPYSFLTDNLSVKEQREMIELYPVRDFTALDPNPQSEIMGGACDGMVRLDDTTHTVGAQTREVAFLDTHITDRVHTAQVIAIYVQRGLDCMKELNEQIDGWLKDEAGNAGVLSVLQDLKGSLAEMEQECREGIAWRGLAQWGDTGDDIVETTQRVAQKLRSLIREEGGVELCLEIRFSIGELNSVESLGESWGSKFGTGARKLFQRAGYACVNEPEAVKYAEEIRVSLRKYMRYQRWESHSSPRGSLLPAE